MALFDTKASMNSVSDKQAAHAIGLLTAYNSLREPRFASGHESPNQK